MKITVPLLFLVVGVVFAQERDPFAGPLEKKASELTQCAKGHKILKDIPVVYGHVGGLMSSPEVRGKAERGEIIFGGCVVGGREHWAACETCGSLYDDEYDSWLESHPPRPMSPDGKSNPPCSLNTFQRTLSNEILGIALKVAGDKPSHLSCSRWQEASVIVGEEAVVISKTNESEIVQQLHTWIKEKGGPKQPASEHPDADDKTWKWESKDKLFVVKLSPSGPNEFFITVDWHRKTTAQPSRVS